MHPVKLLNGHMLIPVPVWVNDQTPSDCYVEIGADDPRYAEWEPWAIPEEATVPVHSDVET